MKTGTPHLINPAAYFPIIVYLIRLNFMRIPFLFFCWLLITAPPGWSQDQNGKKIIAYYTGNGETIKQYPVDKLTHIIYSFLALHGDTLTFRNEAQEKTVKQLVALKDQYPGLKIMVSIGGWGGCAPCSDLFASETHRNNFARSAVGLFKAYGIDGLDLDWEYPSIEGYPGHKYTLEDKDHFTALIKTLRSEMGNRFLLSFAAGGFTNYLEESVDWDAIIPSLDFVNLMTYDLTNGYSKTTGHHTPLKSNKSQKESTDHCVSWLLNHRVPEEKLIIGAAFYARVWEQVPGNNNGLYQPGSFKQGVAFKNFEKYFSDSSGFVYHFDKKAKAPYCYSSSRKLFATFDDKRSIREKSKYVRKKKLGGIMFWELSEDRTTGGLIDEIYKTLQH